jgi:hypothetical protein
MGSYYDQFSEVYSVSDLHLAEGAFVDHDGVAMLAHTLKQLAARAKKQGQGENAFLARRTADSPSGP